MPTKAKGSATVPPPLRRGWTLGASGFLAQGTDYHVGDIVEIRGAQAQTTTQFGVTEVHPVTGAVTAFIVIRNGFYKQDPGTICPTVPITGSGTGFEANCVWLPVGAVTAGIVKMIFKGHLYAVGDEITFTPDTYGDPLTIVVTAIGAWPGDPFGKGYIREYSVVDGGRLTKTPQGYCQQVTTTGAGVDSSVQVTWVPAAPP